MSKRPLHLVGCGLDSHEIIKNLGNESAKAKPLMLGGKVVSEAYCPVAHSDGDSVYHAIVNALLLALGERDIGYHFPDTDPNYSGVASEKMLKRALEFVKDRKYAVNNVTVMITAAEPKIGPHVDDMKSNIAMILGIDKEQVGIGATRGEGLSKQDGVMGIQTVAMVSLISL